MSNDGVGTQLTLKKCANCKKEFYCVAGCYKFKKTRYATKYYCRYNCYTKNGGDNAYNRGI